MRLGERLRRADDPEAEPAPSPDSPVPHRQDPYAHLKHRVSASLFEQMATQLGDAELPAAELRARAEAVLSRILAAEDLPLDDDERRRLVKEIAADAIGYGPITPYLADPAVTEIMANGLGGIWVERSGLLEDTGISFSSEDQLRRVIDRIVSAVGRRVDEASPMVDARLPDGSRVNAVIPPLAVDGPALTIRRFTRTLLGPDDYIASGAATEILFELLSRMVVGKLNILISGGTGTGKTTLLNVLSNAIPERERIVTIEDAVELQLQQRHVVRLESRPRNVEGRGEVTIRDLVRNALRMRPDRIIVGEVRGGEALDMLQAMNTGHEGSLGTVHANTPRDAVSRLETLVLMGGVDLPDRAVREQIAAAIDAIVHVSRLRDGTRRITSVTEITGMEGEQISTNTLFDFDYAAGIAADGMFLGRPQPTGLRPSFASRLAEQGIELPPGLFGSSDGELVAHAVEASRRRRSRTS